MQIMLNIPVTRFLFEDTLASADIAFRNIPTAEVDHGFVDDINERTDILRSPFFDPYPGWDLTVDGYINQISHQLARSIEEHLPSGHWTIVGRRPPSPPPPPPSPSPRVIGAIYLGLISFLKPEIKIRFIPPTSPLTFSSLSPIPTVTLFLIAHGHHFLSPPPPLTHGHLSSPLSSPPHSTQS
ncbi:hypothetical protein M5K25_026639 [Dendrobium thyrsiflorum]|uniref:Uncharacterized protein n=1 Tax=Dendrobium thyrsiflorum TaxID=117978 RepID=A0ABD0TXV8_DENTH